MFGSDEAHKMVKPNSRRRVLKPPGGGSSDIFGVSAEPAEPQRKNRSHLTSSIFSGEDTVTPARNKAGNDSFYNLFGTEPQSRPTSAVKDKFISNIDLDHNQEKVVKKSINFSNKDDIRDSTTYVTAFENNKSGIDTNSLSIANGSLCDDCEDTNKIVSEAPSVNGTSTNSAASSAAPTPTAAPASATANKPRVPPGGFSSGLW